MFKFFTFLKKDTRIPHLQDEMYKVQKRNADLKIHIQMLETQMSNLMEYLDIQEKRIPPTQSRTKFVKKPEPKIVEVHFNDQPVNETSSGTNHNRRKNDFGSGG